jgi:hypothetical protein
VSDDAAANEFARLAVQSMKEQLLIVFLKRLGGSATMHVSEIDDTAQDLFLISVDPKEMIFTFELKKKS